MPTVFATSATAGVWVLTLTGAHVRVFDMATETETTAQALIPRDSLANRLVLIRRELGLSQREAAMRCGVGFGSWQSWENGSSPRNELRKLSQVAEELHVDRDWLLFGGNLRPEEWAARDSNSEPMDSSPVGVSTAELKSEYLRNIGRPVEPSRRTGRPRLQAGAA